MFRQHRQLAEDHRHFLVHPLAQMEFDRVRVHGDGLIHRAVIIAIEGRALLPKGLEGPDHIRRLDRMAIMETRFRPKPEGDRAFVVRYRNPLRQEAVFRVRLVHRLRHQRVVDGRGRGRRRALDDEGIEAVEGPPAQTGHRAALRRVRIDIVEMREIGAVFQVAMNREAVMTFRVLGLCIHANQNRCEPGERAEHGESETLRDATRDHGFSCSRGSLALLGLLGPRWRVFVASSRPPRYCPDPPAYRLSKPRAATLSAGLAAATTVPSLAMVRGSPAQSLTAPPAPSTIGPSAQ